MSECDPWEVPVKPSCFGKDWMALAAGDEKGYNAMTVAWGEVGTLWDRYDTKRHEVYPVATVYVRPQRYTKEFLDREEFFTLSYLGKGHRKELGYLGSCTGRDSAKMAECGLAPVFAYGTVYFAEAELVLVCRKLYCQKLEEASFVDRVLIERNYPERDFHTMYTGEIVRCLSIY